MTDGKVVKMLQTMRKVKFTHSQVVFEEGTIPEAVYIVLKGTFEFVRKLDQPDLRKSTQLNEMLN